MSDLLADSVFDPGGIVANTLSMHKEFTNCTLYLKVEGVYQVPMRTYDDRTEIGGTE